MKCITLLLLLIFLSLPAAAQPPPPGGGGGGTIGIADGPVLTANMSVDGFKICDDDEDTCIELERTADQDIIWLSSLATDIVKILNDGTDSTWTVIADSTNTEPPLQVVDSAEAVTHSFAVDSTPHWRVENASADYLECGLTASGNTFCDTGQLWNLVSSNSIRIDSVETRFYRSGVLKWEIDFTTDAFQAMGTASDGPALLHENPSATNPTVLARVADKDSGLCSAADDQVGLCAGGVAVANAIEGAADSLDVLGCKDFGTLVEPPASPSQCDRYYDSSGAQCFYNGTTWDKVGSGSCA